MRFLTYNIHGCVGTKFHFDPEAIIAVLEAVDADVVALQEVHDDDERDRSFLRRLDRLDYSNVIYGQTMRNPRGRYGNVLMTKPEASHVERIDLSRGIWEPRGAIAAQIEEAGKSIDIIATHLGLAGRERAGQLRLLEECRERRRADLEILMGDLNEWNPATRRSRYLREGFASAKHPRTFPASFPIFRLDRVHLRPSSISYRLETVGGKLAKTASDHLPLLAEIDL